MLISVKKCNEVTSDKRVDKNVDKEYIEVYDFGLQLAEEIFKLIKEDIKDFVYDTYFRSEYCFISMLIDSGSYDIKKLVIEADFKDGIDIDKAMEFVLSCGNIYINYIIENEKFIRKGEKYED